MKIQRNIIYSSVLILLLSSYIIMKSNDANLINILIGIIASSIVLLGSSIVSYMSEKKKCIDNLIVDLHSLCDELGTMRTGNEVADVLYNISLIEKCQMRLLGKIKRDCSELTFLFSNKLRRHIFTAILDPIDMMFSEISIHYGMLRWILLYKSDEDMICAHYLECIRLNSNIDKKEIHYLSIEKYLEISNEERTRYHNNEIISTLICPNNLNTIKGDTVVHVLSFVFAEITVLRFLIYKVFIRDKYIKETRASCEKIACRWDDVSSEIHGALKEEIKKLRTNNHGNH